MRARRAGTPPPRGFVAAVARRRWAAWFAALRRAQPGPERSGGTCPNRSAKVLSARVRKLWMRRLLSHFRTFALTHCFSPAEPVARLDDEHVVGVLAEDGAGVAVEGEVAERLPATALLL